MACKRLLFVSALLLSLPGLVWTQTPAQAPNSPPTSTAPQAEHRQASDPYTGDLFIFDSPGRDQRLQIDRVMDILGIRSGKNVADIGAGSGWFTVRAARRVGALGMVYAVEINPDALRYIHDRAEKEGLHNVKTVMGKSFDPMLPAKVNAVLMLETYHEIAEPVVLLKNLRASLSPGARVGIIDRNGNRENHGLPKEVVIREAAQAGYRLVEQDDFVKPAGMDYFLVFAAK